MSGNNFPQTCGSRTAEGIYRGAFAGAVWALVAAQWGLSSDADGPKAGPANAKAKATATATAPAAAAPSAGGLGLRVPSLAVQTARSSLLFGAILGAFNGTKCACMKLRRKDDWINSWGAGLAARLRKRRWWALSTSRVRAWDAPTATPL